MKILIIGEKFFGYAERIKDFLEKKNYEADLVFGFAPNFRDRIKRKLLGGGFDEKDYYKNVLKKDEIYDYILVINGKFLPDYFVEEIRSNYQGAKKILYVWDDLKNLNQTEEFFGLFDKKYSYSKFDADQNSAFEFRPFFYSKRIKTNAKTIGASFVGSLHSDRYKTLKNIEKLNPKISFFFYLYADFMSYFKYWKETKLKDIRFKVLNYDGYVKTLADSVALIELPHSEQKNITTRAIEVLGTQTKLVTTTHAIKNYDFYNENNIFILDKNNTSEIQNWLTKDYEEYSEELLQKYYIESWIDEILK